MDSQNLARLINQRPITGAVTIAATSTLVLPLNVKRRGVWFCNDSDEAIYVSFGSPATMNKGIRLNASGGSLELNMTNMFYGHIYAICSSGSKVLTVLELD